jgi:hypothetical protein
MLVQNMQNTIERLRIFLEMARLAVAKAKVDNPDARGMAGIGWKLPDNTGKLVCDFDSEPFCDDLEMALDALAKEEDAFLCGAEAMRAACREVADESREAIDALSFPKLPAS